MAEFKTVLSYPIKNNGLTSGVLDDTEVIGGYKIVQTLEDLENLKFIETVELEETATQDWKPRKHILKNGTLVYVEENGALYRWKELASVTDENGIPHATDGEWIIEDNVHTVDENGVLCSKKIFDVNFDEIEVTRQEFDEAVKNSSEALDRLYRATESLVNELLKTNEALDEQDIALREEIKLARNYTDEQIASKLSSSGNVLPTLDKDGVLCF